MLLAACSGGQTAARDAQLAELRERVERLEHESTQERAQLAEDVRALRQSLDEANRQLAELEGAAPPRQGQASPPGKSPRAALRESFNQAVEASRQALERLNKSLDASLSRSRPQQAAPAK